MSAAYGYREDPQNELDDEPPVFGINGGFRVVPEKTMFEAPRPEPQPRAPEDIMVMAPRSLFERSPEPEPIAAPGPFLAPPEKESSKDDKASIGEPIIMSALGSLFGPLKEAVELAHHASEFAEENETPKWRRDNSNGLYNRFAGHGIFAMDPRKQNTPHAFMPK